MDRPPVAQTFPLQPRPIQFFTGSMSFPGGFVCTAITRVWAQGDTRRCRLCERCTADHVLGVCQVVVDQAVGRGLAAEFSAVGLTPVRQARLGLLHAGAE